jgi:DNA-binding response OmpR family regulator
MPIALVATHMILIVDDDANVREMLRRVLVGEGYEVVTAGDGARAVQIAAQVKIDLVLLDLNLPAMDGWDTFERLTSNDPGLAVIIITARTGQQATSDYAGAGALLEKPLDFPNLLRTMNDLLNEPLETRLARLTGHAGRLGRRKFPPTSRFP